MAEAHEMEIEEEGEIGGYADGDEPETTTQRNTWVLPQTQQNYVTVSSPPAAFSKSCLCS